MAETTEDELPALKSRDNAPVRAQGICASHLPRKPSGATVPAYKGPIVGIAGDRLTRLLAGAHQPHLLFGIAAGLCCAAGILLTAGGKLNQAASLDPYIYVYMPDTPTNTPLCWNGLVRPITRSALLTFSHPGRSTIYSAWRAAYFAFGLLPWRPLSRPFLRLGCAFMASRRRNDDVARMICLSARSDARLHVGRKRDAQASEAPADAPGPQFAKG